jgi:SAM-dependent methyltransferase
MSNYDRVAAEYYDAVLHPTCANLRTATEIGFRKRALDLRGAGGRFLEIGCGSPVLASSAVFEHQHLVSIDLNAEMFRDSHGVIAQADVHELPFRRRCFQGVFGSLADPYNTRDMYLEVKRVLTDGGRFVFSVPDYTWSRLNQSRGGLAAHTAELTLATGERVVLPSRVYEYDEQVTRLLECGFGEVQVTHVAMSELDSVGLSSRFLDDSGQPTVESVVTLYAALSPRAPND